MSSLVIDAEALRTLEVNARYIMSLHGVSVAEIDGNDHPNAADARKKALIAYAEAKTALFNTGFKPETIKKLDESTGSEKELAGLTIALRVERARHSYVETPEA